MKKLIFLLFLLSTSTAFGQEEKIDSNKSLLENEIEKIIKVDGEVFTKTTDRYKIYPTKNMYNFLMLDTQTGHVYRIQWSIDDKNRYIEFVSAATLDYDTKVNGRFEIHPTDNIYNFLLLDKIDGRAWQVQWSFKPKENLLIRIL